MKKFILIALITGIATSGFSQDTAKAIIENPVIEEITEPLEIIPEPGLQEDEPLLIDISEEEILVTPDVEEEVKPAETILKEDIQKKAGEEIADEPSGKVEDKEKPKKEKADVVDLVYKIAGASLVIGAFIIFPF